ncbi:cobalamin biosynthesis protein CbiX [Salipaludibacillus sp. CUR1]|uniref:sirohydrochlorin chelatase n=1 Tax=Salipaludibacillus sp. CUR1 TaxID=2820003 RepID=UPI001E36DEF0|nr:cobalamin biosynthesis protein CbiX [Salipaludibacillus sp. CUR1]
MSRSENKAGVLLIAHGSSNPQWEKDIEYAVSKVNTDLTVVLSCLEFTEEKTIEKGIRELEQRGIETIISIPLFISSGSTHIDEIKYALGVKAGTTVTTDLKPVQTHCRIIWREPMNNHPLILDMISERMDALTSEPENETLLIVGHGSDEPGFKQKWEGFLEEIKLEVDKRFSFHKTVYGTLHPDNLRQVAESLPDDKKMLVLPLFLCEGYFTKKVIPRKLEGLAYTSADTYLPHPNVSYWIEDQAAAALAALNNE